MFVLSIHITQLQTNLLYPFWLLEPLFIQIINVTQKNKPQTRVEVLVLSSRPKAGSNVKFFYHGDVPLLFSSP